MKITFTVSIAILTGLSAAGPLPQATSAAACTTYTMLFARGTTETGTLGTVVGPGLQKSVQSALGADQVTVKGTTYAADASGITAEVTGSGPGSVAMAQDATNALSSCPDTKIILTGYSQGAMVVHNAATKLNKAGKSSSVVAAVTFGDPFKTQLPTGVSAARFHTFCANGDSVCASGTGMCAGTGGCTSASTLGHLGYGSDVDTAASFIKSAVGGSTGSTTASSVPVTSTSGSTNTDSGLGSGLGSGFSIPSFSIPASFPTTFPGFGGL